MALLQPESPAVLGLRSAKAHVPCYSKKLNSYVCSCFLQVANFFQVLLLNQAFKVKFFCKNIYSPCSEGSLYPDCFSVDTNSNGENQSEYQLYEK